MVVHVRVILNKIKDLEKKTTIRILPRPDILRASLLLLRLPISIRSCSSCSYNVTSV